jgi:two-component system KDP operon response regulator KdpE
MEPLVLIVEDEKPIRHFMKITLETQKYRCIEAQNGSLALSMIASHRPDIVILDLGLPDLDGLDVIKKCREWSGVPIIVVSARGHEREKVETLDAGADDYLTKPFGVSELLARIRVALRRKAAEAFDEEKLTILTLDDLKIDFEKRKVMISDNEIHLTPIEYNLLTLLAKHRGKVLTHRFIIHEIWGAIPTGDTQTLRVSMGNLRRKMEKDTAQPRYIITEVGVGYRMVDE